MRLINDPVNFKIALQKKKKKEKDTLRFVAIEFLAILTNQLFYASILVEKKWQYFALRRVINLKRKTVVSLQLNSILQQPRVLRV